ncbi:MAG: methyltransferase, partial [Acholeplasmataceae bacterium]|nr:methyltransferase [Acholeplasmataceae bacterium]
MNTKPWIKFQRENRHLTMPILSFPAIQKLGITVSELLYSADYQAQAIKLIASDYPVSASVSLMDLSVEAEVFGALVKYYENEVPTVAQRLLKDAKDVEELEIPEVGQKRDSIYLNTISKAKALLDAKPVFAGMIGPFSLAGRLFGMTEIMIEAYEDPDLVHKLMDKISIYLTSYAKELKKQGADGLIVAEPAAGLLSPNLCSEFSSAYLKKIFSEINDQDFILIYHNCGNVIPLYESITDLDADVYHFGNSIDIEKMLMLMPEDKLVMGNIDPSMQFRHGTPESIAEATRALLERCSKYPNFVISSGCDIPAISDWKNIEAYFSTIISFYN